MRCRISFLTLAGICLHSIIGTVCCCSGVSKPLKVKAVYTSRLSGVFLDFVVGVMVVHITGSLELKTIVAASFTAVL